MKSTITYGENVENHAGNQQIGSFIDAGILIVENFINNKNI
jgi:hypothetical protein